MHFVSFWDKSENFNIHISKARSRISKTVLKPVKQIENLLKKQFLLIISLLDFSLLSHSFESNGCKLGVFKNWSDSLLQTSVLERRSFVIFEYQISNIKK